MTLPRLADKRLLELWGSCRPELLRWYDFGEARALIRPEAFWPLVYLSRELRERGLTPRAFDTWSYACRNIAGTSRRSLHSAGIAVDVRAVQFPHGVRVTDARLLAVAKEVEALVCPNGRPMWTWGGRWRTPDGMHWQLACSPGEAASVGSFAPS